MVLLLRNVKWLGLLFLVAAIGVFASTGHAGYCTTKWGPQNSRWSHAAGRPRHEHRP